mmetsp:Transcript_11672/g.43239  ORF Transcript_11672/g.43239 Transcript_11672/m.43239 type:complete len:269 (-) Transcript_11672:859-1665(-)
MESFVPISDSSNATISAHTDERINLRCFFSSNVGRAPNAHCNDCVSFGTAPVPSAHCAVDASRAAHFPLCATATKSNVPSCSPREPGEDARFHRTGEVSSVPSRVGVIAPTHLGRTTVTFSQSARCVVSFFNPPTPTYRVAPSRKGTNIPDDASSTPTFASGHSPMRPISCHSRAILSKTDPGVAVKYWHAWSQLKARPRSSTASRVLARPPTAFSPVSNTVARMPRTESSRANTNPEIPPPTTATCAARESPIARRVVTKSWCHFLG